VPTALENGQRSPKASRPSVARRIAAIIALALALVAAGCGGASNERSTVATEGSGSTGAGGMASPEGCLSQAGLSNVEQRGVNLWRGNNDEPFFLVLVHSLGSAEKAKEAARQANLVYAYAAGRYFVAGPVKLADDQGITKSVGDCLARPNTDAFTAIGEHRSSL
jgi:hypothetical protein